MTPILGTTTILESAAIRLLVQNNPLASAREVAIIGAYYDLAPAYGIDGSAALAQCFHETGYLASAWAQQPYNNMAGIGVTGKQQPTNPQSYGWVLNRTTGMWIEGCVFADERAGVAAHLAHLYAYASADHNALCCFTDPRHFRVTPHPNSAHTLIDLNGKWAYPGTTYGTQIQTIYDAMARG